MSSAGTKLPLQSLIATPTPIHFSSLKTAPSSFTSSRFSGGLLQVCSLGKATALRGGTKVYSTKKVRENGRLVPEFADKEEDKLYEFLDLELQSQMKVDRMRHYEVVYLIHEKHQDEVANVNDKVQDFIREKKGRIWRMNDWGMRRLAYKIQKVNNAHYILMNFEVEAKYINEFKTMLDQDERVIRHLVIKRDEAITEDCPPPPEFHTLRANTDDDYDEEDDLEYDDEEYDEDDDEDGVEVEYYEEEDMEYKNIVAGNDDDSDGSNTSRNNKAANGSSREKQTYLETNRVSR